MWAPNRSPRSILNGPIARCELRLVVDAAEERSKTRIDAYPRFCPLSDRGERAARTSVRAAQAPMGLRGVLHDGYDRVRLIISSRPLR